MQTLASQDDSQDAQSRATILFVDDEKNILSSLKRLFRNEGYKILIAESGAEGLAYLQNEPVDLVVSDMRMPEMTGLEVTRVWRETEPDHKRIPIIALTANSTTIERNQCFEAGMDHFITKPVSQARLMEVIQEVI